MLRGESPQQFMQNLAKTNPKLQELDLNNLSQTAESLCKQNGENYDTAKNTIMDNLGQFIANK